MAAVLDVILTTTKSSPKSSFSFIILIVILGYGAFYFLVIRPRNRRAREQRSEGRKFDVGDTVQTIGGLIATVSQVDDRTVTLRTESGTEMRFLKQAIAQKYRDPDEEPEPEDAAPEVIDDDPPADGSH